MSDALISPAVGLTMLAASGGAAAYSIKKIQDDMDDKQVPLMGVMGAFVFAAQMINFSIPGTGASGHIGGGMLLAALLGPYAGFLTMASILLIQALFFGDGGLLAYGCNVFNLGFYTCFIAYPYIYKRITRKNVNSKRIFAASIASSLIGLQMGAFSVVLQTLLSGKTELPFGTFVLLMQPIHLAIGIVEGLVTAAIVAFVWKARPEIIDKNAAAEEINSASEISVKKLLAVFIIAVIVVGGVLSWFASSNPDGLEWSIEKTAGEAELEIPDGIHNKLLEIQGKTAFLPDYGFKEGNSKVSDSEKKEAQPVAEAKIEDEEAWPAVSAGTSVSGIIGGALTLALASLIGLSVRIAKRKKKSAVA